MAKLSSRSYRLSCIVAVLTGMLLPRLTVRDTRLLAHGEEDVDTEFARLKSTVQEWRADAARRGRPLRLPVMPFFLRNIWTGAMLFFALLTFMTFFVTKVWQVGCTQFLTIPMTLTTFQAIIIVSLVGVCWAVACWVPFAIIMEVCGNDSGLFQQRFDIFCSFSKNESMRLHPRKKLFKRGLAARRIAERERHLPELAMSESLCYGADVPSKRRRMLLRRQPRKMSLWLVVPFSVSTTWLLYSPSSS